MYINSLNVISRQNINRNFWIMDLLIYTLYSFFLSIKTIRYIVKLLVEHWHAGKGLTWRHTIYGHFWTTSNGMLATLFASVWLMLISRIIWNDIWRVQLDGSSSCLKSKTLINWLSRSCVWVSSMRRPESTVNSFHSIRFSVLYSVKKK